MVIIEYTKKGTPVSDFNYRGWIMTVIKASKAKRPANFIYRVSTSLPIDAVRLAVVHKQISHDQVVFRYKGKLLYMNEYGVIQNWPKGFADVLIWITRDIVMGACHLNEVNRNLKQRYPHLARHLGV